MFGSLQWIVGLSMLAFVLGGCGNNDTFRQVGTYQTAPAPVYQPTNPGGPVFRPQYPPNMPTPFYPFVPMYQYMQNSPQMRQTWNTLWIGWQNYAPSHGYYIYDFVPFWFNYCGQQMGYGQYAPVYQYLDQSFYYWMTPQTQFNIDIDIDFWSGYSGYPMDYSYCNSWCR